MPELQHPHRDKDGPSAEQVLDRVSGHEVSGGSEDLAVEALGELGQNVISDDVPEHGRMAVARAIEQQNRRQRDHRIELHQRVKAQISDAGKFAAPPDFYAEDTQCEKRREQQQAHARVNAFRDCRAEDAHEEECHWETIPKQRGVVRGPMIVAAAESDEDRGAGDDQPRPAVAALIPFRRGPDADTVDPGENERKVGENVPEEWYAPPLALVGKVVILGILRDRRQRDREDDRDQCERIEQKKTRLQQSDYSPTMGRC